MGGRNTFRSERVTSSGYMPPVSSNSTRRRSVSLQPKRSATAGRYHTGSTATLVTMARTAFGQHLAVGHQAAGLLHGVDHLGQDDMGLGHGDGGRMS
jgi:hypothetical protein